VQVLTSCDQTQKYALLTLGSSLNHLLNPKVFYTATPRVSSMGVNDLGMNIEHFQSAPHSVLSHARKWPSLDLSSD